MKSTKEQKKNFETVHKYQEEGSEVTRSKSAKERNQDQKHEKNARKTLD